MYSSTYWSTVSGLHNQAQVWGQCTSVAGTGSLFVGIRCRHVVRELSRTLEHLALVIRTIFVLDFFSQSLGFISGMGNTNKITPSDAVQGMTCSTNFTVDLVATADAVYILEVKEQGLHGGHMTRTWRDRKSQTSLSGTRGSVEDASLLRQGSWRALHQ